MDATLDEIAEALLNQRLPDNWRKLAPETCMQLAAWLNHLQVHSYAFHSFIKSWAIASLLYRAAYVHNSLVHRLSSVCNSNKHAHGPLYMKMIVASHVNR